MRRIYLSLILVLTVAALAACASNTPEAPVPMRPFEGKTLSARYPQGWETSSAEVLDTTMIVFSTKKPNISEMGRLDFESLMFKEPVVVLMSVPPELTEQMGVDDLDNAIDEFTPDAGEDVKVVERGKTTLAGLEGLFVVAKGTLSGSGQVGVRAAVAKRADGMVVVIMAVSPEKDLEQNMRIFEAMQRSVRLVS